jgi:hypothetical protein
VRAYENVRCVDTTTAALEKFRHDRSDHGVIPPLPAPSWPAIPTGAQPHRRHHHGLPWPVDVETDASVSMWAGMRGWVAGRRLDLLIILQWSEWVRWRTASSINRGPSCSPSQNAGRWQGVQGSVYSAKVQQCDLHMCAGHRDSSAAHLMHPCATVPLHGHAAACTSTCSLKFENLISIMHGAWLSTHAHVQRTRIARRIPRSALKSHLSALWRSGRSGCHHGHNHKRGHGRARMPRTGKHREDRFCAHACCTHGWCACQSRHRVFAAVHTLARQPTSS